MKKFNKRSGLSFGGVEIKNMAKLRSAFVIKTCPFNPEMSLRIKRAPEGSSFTVKQEYNHHLFGLRLPVMSYSLTQRMLFHAPAFSNMVGKVFAVNVNVLAMTVAALNT